MAQPAHALDSKVKRYTVLTAGPGFQTGVTKNYQLWQDSLRDHGQPWNGRAAICLAAGAAGSRHDARRLAEAAYRQAKDMAPDQLVPYLV